MKLAGRENKIAVVVGTVTDDVRIQDIPKLKVSFPQAEYITLIHYIYFSVNVSLLTDKHYKALNFFFLSHRSVLSG